jgi:hypothetical protein
MNAPMKGFFQGRLRIPGRDSLPNVGGRPVTPLGLMVSPSYFATTGLHLLSGRLLTGADRPLAPKPGFYRTISAAVVNETMAKAIWPGEQAVGKCMSLNPVSDACTQVVGVVSDAHLSTIVEPTKATYYVLLIVQQAHVVTVRAAPGQETLVAESLRRTLRARFPSAEPPVVTSMADALAPQLRPWRLGAALFLGFGLLALAIAAVGVYGVVSYGVSQRTVEMGVRIALGATSGQVLRLVAGEGVGTVAVGVVIGGVIVLLSGQLVESMLYETSPHDPLVMIAVAGTLCAAAAAASLVPAWRATRVDPVTALRTE